MKQKQSLLELFRELEKTQTELARIQAGDVSAYTANGKKAMDMITDPAYIAEMKTRVADIVTAWASEYLNGPAR